MLNLVIRLCSCVSSSTVLSAVETVLNISDKLIDVGKGGQVKDLDGDEEDGFDECTHTNKNLARDEI
jgi:hypothetical protein